MLSITRATLGFVLAIAVTGVASADPAPIVFAGQGGQGASPAPVQTAALTGGGDASYGYGQTRRGERGAVIDLRRPANRDPRAEAPVFVSAPPEAEEETPAPAPVVVQAQAQAQAAQRRRPAATRFRIVRGRGLWPRGVCARAFRRLRRGRRWWVRTREKPRLRCKRPRCVGGIKGEYIRRGAARRSGPKGKLSAPERAKR